MAPDFVLGGKNSNEKNLSLDSILHCREKPSLEMHLKLAFIVDDLSIIDFEI